MCVALIATATTLIFQNRTHFVGSICHKNKEIILTIVLKSYCVIKVGRPLLLRKQHGHRGNVLAKAIARRVHKFLPS
jgi:hypothetical protein